MFGSNMANARFVTWQMLDSYQGIASAMPQSPQKTAAPSGAAGRAAISSETFHPRNTIASALPAQKIA
jgi:hypothetical protein